MNKYKNHSFIQLINIYWEFTKIQTLFLGTANIVVNKTENKSCLCGAYIIKDGESTNM